VPERGVGGGGDCPRSEFKGQRRVDAPLFAWTLRVLALTAVRSPGFSSADPLAKRPTKVTSIAATSATATTFRCVTGSAATRDVFMLNPQHDLTRYYSLERGREIQMNTLGEIP
jgi:hypothetical protein